MADTDTAWRNVVSDFGDGSYTFALDWAGLTELERLRGGVGPLVILDRLAGPFAVADVREVIRLGLIGGGMAPVDALRLVRTYVEGRPLLENLALAYRVLARSLTGKDTVAEEQPAGNGSTAAGD